MLGFVANTDPVIAVAKFSDIEHSQHKLQSLYNGVYVTSILIEL